MIFAPKDGAKSIRKKLNFGFEPDRSYSLGTNGKMDELHAAVALSQLERIDGIQRARTANAARYRSLFETVPQVRLPAATATDGGWTMYPVIFEGRSIDDIIAKALENGIETRRYYWPTVSMAVHEPITTPVSLEVSNRISNQIVCFTLYSSNADHLASGLFEALGKVFT